MRAVIKKQGNSKFYGVITAIFVLAVVLTSQIVTTVNAVTTTPVYGGTIGFDPKRLDTYGPVIASAPASDGSVYILMSSKIVQFSNTGSIITSFGDAGSGDGQISGAVDIDTGSNGDVYVLDGGNQRVEVFSANGQYVSQFPWHSTNSSTTLEVSSTAIYIGQPNDNLIDKYDIDGTYSSTFGGSGTSDGEFGRLDDMALSTDGDIYTIDSQLQRVQQFDENGTYIAQFSIADAASYIAVDGDGNVYVAGTDANTNKQYIHKYNSLGVLDTQFASTIGTRIDNDSINDIKVDSVGNIYEANAARAVVAELSGSGSFVAQYGVSPLDSGQILQPYNITHDDLGNIYVADVGVGVVSEYASNGSFVRAYGVGRSMYPRAVAVAANGNVYISQIGTDVVDVFDPSGVFLFDFGSTGSGDGEFSQISGMAFGANGDLYILDGGNNRIQIVGLDGTYISQFGGVGSDNGELNNPFSIAIAPDNSVYVADLGNTRVEKFDKDGNYLLQFYSQGPDDDQLTGSIFGVAVDSEGTVYVNDASGQRVQLFNANGAYLSNFSTGVTGPYAFYIALTYNPVNASIYLADYNYRRAVYFTTSLTPGGSTPVVDPIITPSSPQTNGGSANTITSSPVVKPGAKPVTPISADDAIQTVVVDPTTGSPVLNSSSTPSATETATKANEDTAAQSTASKGIPLIGKVGIGAGAAVIVVAGVGFVAARGRKG